MNRGLWKKSPIFDKYNKIVEDTEEEEEEKKTPDVHCFDSFENPEIPDYLNTQFQINNDNKYDPGWKKSGEIPDEYLDYFKSPMKKEDIKTLKRLLKNLREPTNTNTNTNKHKPLLTITECKIEDNEVNPKTPLIKEEENEVNSKTPPIEEENEVNPKTPPIQIENKKTDRKSKGLRTFSTQLLNIIQSKNQITRDEINDYFPCQKLIRKKICDIINILESTEVIKKNGKIIIMLDKRINHNKNDLNSIKKKIKIAKANLQSKRRCVKELKEKISAIKKLMQINKEHGSNRPSIINIVKKNPIQSSNETNQIFKIPFIVLQGKEPRNLILSMSKDKKELDIKSNSYFTLMGDIEVVLTLLKLGKPGSHLDNDV